MFAYRGRSRRRAQGSLANRWWVLALLAFLILGGLLTYALIEPLWVEVKDYTFASADLPPQFAGKTIVLLTDIHRGPFLSEKRVRQLVERVNALSPDLVILAGDYVYGGSKYQQSCFAALANLRAPLGSYAVLGNHDYDDDSGAAAAAAARKAGITLLRNAGVWLESQGARLRLCGVEDYQLGSPQLTPALGDANTSDFVLLVSHNPDFAGELSPGAVDLMVSGHTHGGQVTLFGLWAPFVPSKYGQKFRSGMVSTEAATVVISNGIGTIFPPIRLGTRPQIVRITLTAGQNP